MGSPSDKRPGDLWFLDCPQCELFLAADPLWAKNPGDVPETSDEAKAREAYGGGGGGGEGAAVQPGGHGIQAGAQGGGGDGHVPARRPKCLSKSASSTPFQIGSELSA